MKTVLLLGDSIRQNYEEYVKKNLEERANVIYPKDNGRFCQYTLRYLHEWIKALTKSKSEEISIVHFNCGLWDVLRLSNEEELFTDEEMYRILLHRIYKRIKFLCPNTSVIFALTTKVIEPGFGQGEAVARRYNADIKKYNEIAKRLFNDLNDEIDDLWTISANLPQEAYSDNVHFATAQGVEVLGKQVVNCLKKYL